MTALWDTGAQVSIITECFLKQQLPDMNVRDINKLPGTDADLQFNCRKRNFNTLQRLGGSNISIEQRRRKESDCSFFSDGGICRPANHQLQRHIIVSQRQ